MPREVIEISLSAMEAYEAGAIFFAALAHPENAHERDRFRRTLCRWYLLRRAELDATWADSYQRMKPAYFVGLERTWNACWSQGAKKINVRLNCAKFIGLPMLMKDPPSGYYQLKELKKFSIDFVNLIALAKEELGHEGTNHSTFKDRNWRRTKPVIHAASAFLMLAFYVAEQEQSSIKKWPPLMYLFMSSRDLLETVIDHSEINRSWLPSVKGIRIKEGGTIKFVAT